MSIKFSIAKSELSKVLAYFVVVILVVIPFHAFLTIWASSIFGHYTLFRLWKEYLLAALLIGTISLFITDKKLRKQLIDNRIFFLIILYLAVEVIWAIVSYVHHQVDKKALFYGLLLNCRYLIFFLITWAISLKTKLLNTNANKLVIWPALIVILFGLAQIFVLPNNFLTHFGYGPNTISAVETINHNSNYVRIESTLRGANPLGAYIIIPLTMISVLLFKRRKSWQKLSFIIGALIVLLFSFSRSAWLGALVAMFIALFYCLKTDALRKSLLYLSACLIVVIAGLTFVLRNNVRVQNIIWHTQTHSAVKTTSDQGHGSALRSGIKDVINDPFGRGPGTAGPASVYNNHPARIAENYYIQIGQETGWIGLALFILINYFIAYALYLRRADNLALTLFASFIGLVVVNMLSHAWSDDTLAYLWWGLAAVAYAKQPSAVQQGV
jgi:hypothetical protein